MLHARDLRTAGADMMSKHLESPTVGDIVAADVRTAEVFDRFGIDFCCGGRRSFDDACRSAEVDPRVVLKALNALSRQQAEGDDVTRWPLDRLIDHIETTHHAYVRGALPSIARHLGKLLDAHGVRHPELVRIGQVFAKMSEEMRQHMLKEERVLFPYVRDLADRQKTACGRAISPFGTVENPIRMMEREHREAAGALRLIRELTGGYAVPEDGCATYAVCMAELAQFEHDLHRHVHLENNVLFPRAVALERPALAP
jgi:regulator of cell morphogenesis and NO signaling